MPANCIKGGTRTVLSQSVNREAYTVFHKTDIEMEVPTSSILTIKDSLASGREDTGTSAEEPGLGNSYDSENVSDTVTDHQNEERELMGFCRGHTHLEPHLVPKLISKTTR